MALISNTNLFRDCVQTNLLDDIVEFHLDRFYIRLTLTDIDFWPSDVGILWVSWDKAAIFCWWLHASISDYQILPSAKTWVSSKDSVKIATNAA